MSQRFRCTAKRPAMLVRRPGRRPAGAARHLRQLNVAPQRGVPGTRCAVARAAEEELEVAEDTIRDELGDLAVRIEELAKSVDEGLQGTSIFLVGMMGSGKTTTGRMLAHILKYCFFDSDAVIEQAVGGASVSEVFAENGEEGFRDIERSVLSELASYRNCVVATGGGAVTKPKNWGAMQVGVTVYLDGAPELLAARVLAQDGGASRPLLAGAEGDGALAETTETLTAILKERESLYRNADCVVGIKGDAELGATAPEVVCRVLTSIDMKVKESAAERAERQQVEIKYEDAAQAPATPPPTPPPT